MFENVLNAVRTFAVLGFALIASTLSAQNVVLTQSPVTTGDQFGRSVDIDGTYAVVGAPNYDPASGANAGAAFIYKQDGGTWTQEAVLLAGDASDNLGISAAISGTRAVVGAYNAEPGGLWAAGAAYVFTRNSGTGSWDRVQLVPSDPQMAINFGFSVDIDGDTIIVGAYNYDEGGFVNDNDGAISNSGTVYVFQFDGTNWIQQARLTAPAAEITDSRRFGHSVSIDGDVLLVGAMTADETGKAYVFTRSGSTWSAPVELVPSITAPNARYGQAVSLDLPHAIVGAGNLGAAGTAFIFRLDAGTWTETASLVAPDLEATSLFGTAVSIRGDVALIGAPQDDFSGLINPGSVRLYRLSGGNWTHEQVLTAETPANGHALVITPTIIIYYPGFGFSTAFDGVNAIVGDHNRPPAYQGAAEIISLVDPVDVSITKTLTTAGPYFHGQSVAYTLLVSNAGTGAATDVTVTDTPTNLSITAVSGGGCVALPCTIPTLAAASSVSINVTATITAPGAFDNSATATAFEPDPDTTNNTDSTGNGGTAAPLADVSVAKTLITGPPYVHGQTIAYTIEVQNAGPSTASAIVVTDTPQNLTLTSVASASCVALPCSIPSLAAGATETINVTALITAPGAFDNTAQAVGTELDPVPANNVDASGNGGTATAAADLSISKTLNTGGPWIDGQTLTYTISVTNNGPSTATLLEITDVPSNLTIASCPIFCTVATIPSLAPGEFTTFTVDATISGPGAFDNGAMVFGNETDPILMNNMDTSGNGGTATASADLSIAKTLVTAGPYQAGQTITYELLIANVGPSPASALLVTDTPVNLSVTSVSGAGCAALPCTIPTLASAASATITVVATILADGAFSNSASVDAAEDDPDLTNNADASTGTAVAAADLSIVKTLNTPAPYNAGETVAYTLTIANAGPSPATGIQVTDTPSGMTITNVTGSGCAAFPCTIPSLAAGASTTIDILATLGAGSAFDNVASVAGTELDPNPADNTDATGNGGTTGTAADLSIVKTLTTAGPFTDGQTVAYTIAISNAGPSAASAVTVTDTPANLTITSVSGAGCLAFPCTIPTLGSGSGLTINVTATIASAGAFDNGAAVTATESDPNPADNNDPAGNGGTATASADVSIVKTLITAGPFSAGQSVAYTLTVSNAGPSAATGVQITDTPVNLTITSVSGACVALPCTVANLASGASATIDVTADISAAGAFDNAASVAATEPDPALANNSDIGNGGTAATAADLSIVKTLATAGPFDTGQTIAYTIVVANAGPSPATGVTITDTPSNLTIATVGGGSCAALPCTVPSLASGSSITIDVTAVIDSAGAFDNSASVTGVEADPDPANNTDASGNGGGVGMADVSITSTLMTSTPFYQGQVVTYSIVVSNAGPASATSIAITDTWTNLTVGTVSGACTALPCVIPTLAPSTSTTIEVTATIGAAGAFDQVVSVLAAETDPDMANNSDATGNGGSAVAAESIPFTSTTVLMLLALALAIAGSAFIGKA